MIRTYDPSQVVVAIGGVVMGGWADGSFVKVARENDTFSKVTGADGVTSRAKMGDKSTVLTLTFAQTSPSNDILSVLHNVDERTAKGVVPVVIKDLSGTSTFFSGNGWIRKPADFEGAKEISNSEWTLDLANCEFFKGGNDVLSPIL